MNYKQNSENRHSNQNSENWSSPVMDTVLHYRTDEGSCIILLYNFKAVFQYIVVVSVSEQWKEEEKKKNSLYARDKV